MDANELRRLLDDVTAGRRTVEALDRVAGGLARDDLQQALDYVSERSGLADEVHDIAAWTRMTADLLFRWSLATGDDLAGTLAGTAADLYRSDLQDIESAELARAVATVRTLNPVALATLFDQAGTDLPEEPRIRLVRALAAAGDDATKARFQPMLDSALEARAQRRAREAAQMGRLAQARERMAGGGGKDEVVQLLDQHIEATPGDREALALVTQALSEAGRDGEIEFRFRRGLDTLEPHRRADVLFDLAKVHREVRHDDLRAIAVAEEVLALDRAHPGALDVWMSAMESAGQGDEALASLEKRRTEAAGSPDEARLLPVLARAYQAAGRPDDAERTWRRLRAIDPRNVAALRFYEEYHRARGDYQTLFTTLQFLLSVVDGVEERIRVNRTMAAVAEEHLKNPERAIEAFKRVLSLDPSDTEAETALVGLYERARKWHALVEFHNDRLRRLPAEAIEEKVATLFKIIDIYQDADRLPNADNVLATYARIVEVSPTNKEALETLARGYQDRERWPDLLKVLQKKVFVTEDPAELLELFQQIAEIAITRMSNETQAIPFLERILELDPENLAVVQRLKAIYQHKHNQEKLYAMHLRELKMLTGPEREQVLLATAAMARDRLLRYDEALGLYEELYLTNTNSREARENLHQLYTRLERWQDYAGFLSEEVERPMPTRRRIELMHKWGEVLADRLGDVNRAREVFERVLGLDAADDIAARRLEQIYLEQEDLPALRKMFAGRQDPRSFVALLSQREAKEADLSRKVSLNLAMAKACEEDLGEPTRALRYLEKAFSLDHGLVEVGRRLLVAYEQQGDLDRVAEVLHDLAPSVADAAERMDLFSRQHDVLARLGNLSAAFQAGTDAVRVAIGLGRAQPVLDKVRNTARDGGLWQEFAGLLEEVAAATMDPDFRQAVLLELGQVLKGRLLFHDDAREVLERVLDLDPGNLAALDLLEDIALQREDWVGLENVLRRRIDVAQGGDEARDIRMRLGRLYEDLLGDDSAAAECYSQVVQESHEDREALAGLHRTYERTERWVDLADVIRMEIAAAAGADWERMRLGAELAQVCWEHLDDMDEALRLLQASLASEAHATEALRQLRILFDRRVAREAAGNLLAPYYRATGRVDELLDLLQARLEDVVRPEAAAAILMEMADIRDRAKGDAAGAFTLVAAAVQRHPAESFVDRLCVLAEATGRYRDAAVTIGRWVGIVPEGMAISENTIPDPVREARFALILGRLYAERLDEPRLAIKALEKALPFEGGDERLLRTLLDLYRKVGDGEAVLQTFERLADAAATTAARREILLVRAQYAREQGRDDDAIDTLQHVLDLEPGEDAAQDLEGLLRGRERWSDLVRLLERWETWTTDGKSRAELLRRQAEVQGEKLGRDDRAADLLRRALVEDRSREDLRAAGEALALGRERPGWREWAPPLLSVLEDVLKVEGGQPQRLVRLYAAKADIASSPWDRVVALNEMAALLREQGDLEGAFDARVKALETMPDDGSLADAVVEAGEAAGQPLRVVETLEAVAPTAGIEGRVRLLLRVARTWRTRLDDAGRAMSIYDQLLELQPGSMDVLREMDDLLHSQGREAERIPLLSEMAIAAPSLDERRQTHLSIGDLCQATGDFEGAARAFRYVLDRRPSEEVLDAPSLEAARRLLSLADMTGHTREAVDLHLLIGGAAADGVVSRQHRLMAARTLRDVLKDSLEAGRVYDEMLSADPTDAEARSEAKALAREGRDVPRLLDLLKTQLEHAPDPAARIAPLVELADLHLARDEFGRLDALVCLEEILQIQPGQAEAVDRVEALLPDAGAGAEAARLLLVSAERIGDTERQARALEVLAGREDDPVRATALRLRLAACLRSLGRNEESRKVLGDAYTETPEDPAVFETLSEALAADDVLEELAGLTACGAAGLGDLPARLSVRLRAAAVLMRGGLRQPMVRLLEANVADQEGHLPTLEMLTAVYEALQDREGMLSAMERISRATTGREERREAWRRCAILAEEGLHDADRARELWWKVLHEEDLDGQALERLGALAAGARDVEAMLNLDRYELKHRAERGQAADADRMMELRRRLAVGALEAGYAAQAIEGAKDLLECGSIDVLDLAVARRVYAEAGAPPELFVALAAGYESVQDRDGLLDLYRYAAGLDLDVPPRAEALRLAVDLEELLGREDELFEDLSSLVVVEPADAALRARLVTVAQRATRLEEAKASLTEAFAALKDRPEAFEVAMTIGRLLRDELAGEEEAADWFRLAFLRRPGEPQVVDALSILYAKLSRFGDLALLYESLGDLEQDEAERLSWYFKAYDVVRFRVKDAVGAGEILKKVLDQDPGNRGALEGLESIARETADAGALGLWLSRRAEVATLMPERRATLLELAGVQQGPLNDPAAAIETLRGLLETDPQCAEAWQRLEELYVSTNRWEDLASLYEQQADASVSREEKVAALKKAAGVRESRLEDSAAAVQLLRRILDVDESNTYAFFRLGELLESANDAAGLAELLAARLAHSAGTAEQVDLHARVGTLWTTRLGDDARALEHFKAALAADPFHVPARRGMEALLDSPVAAMEAALALEGVYEGAGEHGSLCGVLLREIPLMVGNAEREAVRMRIAELRSERLDDVPGAMDMLGEVLMDAPGHRDAAARLEALAGRIGAWDRLVGLLAEAAERAEVPEDRSRLRLAAAEIAEKRMSQPAKAADFYSAHVAENPGDELVLEELDRLYQSLHRTEDQVRVLRMRIAALGDAVPEEMRLRLATLLSQGGAEVEDAVEQLRRVLVEQPGNAEAIRQLSTLSSDPLAGRQALEVLRTAFRESGDDEGLLWASERLIDAAGESADVVSLHDEAAGAARRLGRRTVEVEHLGRALELVPSDEGVLVRLLKAAREVSLHASAFGYLVRAAKGASWPELEKSLLLQAVRLSATAEVPAEEVEACLKRVLDLDPSCREALEALDRTYAAEGRATDLAGVLEQRLRGDLSAEDRIGVLSRLAKIFEDDGDLQRAAQLLEESAGIHAEPGVLKSLWRLAQAMDDVPGQIRALERLAECTPGVDERVRHLLEAASLWENRLQEKTAAVATLEKVRELDPANVAARMRLEKLYDDLGEWEPLVAMLTDAVDVEGPAVERREAAMKAAAITETHLDNLLEAVALVKRAAEIDPDDDAVLDELIRLFYRCEDWTGLVGVLRRKASRTAVKADQVALLAKACDVAVHRLGDLALGGGLARQIMAIDPQHPRALLTMARLMEQREQNEEAANLYQRLAQSTTDADERVDALVGLARLRMARGDRGEEVRKALQDAAKLRPQHAEVNRHLKKLFQESGEHHALIEVMLRELKLANDDAERSSICMDVAEIYLKEMNDGAKFLQWAEEAHRFRRDDPRVVGGIVRFHLQSGEPRRAVPYMEWLVSYLEAKRRLKELPPYAYELGRILESMGQEEKAIQYYRLAHEHDAGNVQNALALGRLFLSRGENEKALRVYQPLILRMDGLAAPARIEVLLSLARLHVSLGDKRKARQFVLRVLQEEPENAEAQAILSRGL
mgnify:CR=1 FL=1